MLGDGVVLESVQICARGSFLQMGGRRAEDSGRVRGALNCTQQAGCRCSAPDIHVISHNHLHIQLMQGVARR